MKLYYATGTCSLAPRIAAREAGLPLEAESVDLATHRTQSGADYFTVNPKGYVPALALDGGGVLTEGVAILSYLADCAPAARLAPEAGTLERYRLLEWLTFISSEIHKSFSPLFNPKTPEAARELQKEAITRRFAAVERHLATGPYLLGDRFTIADAYLFTIAGWSRFAAVDLEPFPALRAYLARVGDRPRVKEAMRDEGMAA